MTSEKFTHQNLIFNIFNFAFCASVLLLTFLFFKENNNYRDRDQNLLPGLKTLFKSKNFIKLLSAMSLTNGCIVLITSVINIMAINHNIPSYIASICVFGGTLLGTIYSMSYPKFFERVEDHRYSMAFHLFISGIFVFLLGLALYYESSLMLLIFYGLFGIFSLHPIPHYMEKTSNDFKGTSYNVINLGNLKKLVMNCELYTLNLKRKFISFNILKQSN